MGSADRSKIDGIVVAEKGARSCVECRATTTPMWRSGPTGPRSLCNACGIRYRKKRRQELGLDHKQQQQQNNGEAKAEVKDSSSNSSSSGRTHSQGMGHGAVVPSNDISKPPTSEDALESSSNVSRRPSVTPRSPHPDVSLLSQTLESPRSCPEPSFQYDPTGPVGAWVQEDEGGSYVLLVRLVGTTAGHLSNRSTKQRGHKVLLK